MSFLRILLALAILPVMALADDDKNFKIPLDYYKVGEVFKATPDVALKSDGSLVSQKPVFPLKKNVLYLRHKLGAKEYQWLMAKPSGSNIKKLHAFDLKKNRLKANEVVLMRFYGSQNAKAFQDEDDLYFDNNYIYSSRVTKLFFIKNSRWQQLKEDSLPGAIKVDSPVENLEMKSVGGTLDNLANFMFPVPQGVYSIVFDAPDYMPVVEIGVVKPGSMAVLKPNLIKLEIKNEQLPELTVSSEMVAGTKSLEETELLFDKFVAELSNVTYVSDTSGFNSIYPDKQHFAALNLQEDDWDYKEYCKRYKVVRENAKNKWLSSQVAGISNIQKAFQVKFDSLQALPLRGSIPPTAVVFDTVLVDSLVKDTTRSPYVPVAMNLNFGADHQRFDVAWKGSFDGLSLDSIQQWLATNPSSVKFYLTLENNKPVWIYKEGVMMGRHQYRYVKLEAEVNGQLYNGTGNFVLPEYILEKQEVQEWLHPKKEEPIPESSSSAITSSASQDSVMMSSSSAAVPVMKIVNDPLRGPLALIDSGSFRFHGRIVQMSPFAIGTTEMTQELFERSMLRLDSAKRIKDKSSFFHPKKPVHNINWENARMVCKANGGDLPTEAQWEYAGLADNNEGSVWNLDSVPNPGVYAVYKENSYKQDEQSDAYGPQPVGSKKPNAWGLYDMSGNVAEWTRDRYFMFSFWVESSNPTGALMGYSRIYKGGSWKDKESLLNLTKYDDEDPRYWSDWIGFRCVYPIDAVTK